MIVDTPYEFWEKYYKADEIKRLEMLDYLAEFVNDSSLIQDEKIKLHSTKSVLKAYFDDLIRFMESKNERL